MLNKAQIIAGIVFIALLCGGIGYMAGNTGTQQVQAALVKAQAENAVLKGQVTEAEKKSASLTAELAAAKAGADSALKLDPDTLASLKRAGIADPAVLLEDLKRNPDVIPEQAVLGGTMQFTRVGIIDAHWVYGAYEDGHIAGAAVFQWENRDSGIIWTPILVFKE